MVRRSVLFGVLCLLATPMSAASYAEMQAARPELFDPDTGYRISRHRAPTPEDIPPPAQVVTAEEARTLLANGALALDVFGAAQSRFDELDGTWLVSKPRMSLPGALWLPETGAGAIQPAILRYLVDNLARATDGDTARPIVVFCISDCWISWNAAQRIAGLGYTRVFWFRNGTDGWLDIGGTLQEVRPVPVDVD
ncbi:PQQ-dependent catabolism-associated CXXCW motif protein [Sedimentitalea arenosa]|uniref:PQQ-dependent catabolism-associated CXXCW motif protein n=1 Tax=Sedimentitalea arenosa TaxID=2798803 RepID=A0A8J7IUT0_9RHOB|nr:PQQ-dependent catabolism-associated CXXCW motif protein [Arenibacterium arenosum]MBJ6373201.1 PQQ-dependent catabolism-associated CXXCW motif protein [Arenibacterium arenosum]